MNAQGLVSNMWLLAYEADLKGWLQGSTAYVDAHPYFGELKKRKVSFYDIKRNVKDIRKSKPKKLSNSLVDFIANLKSQESVMTRSAPTKFFLTGIFGGYGEQY